MMTALSEIAERLHDRAMSYGADSIDILVVDEESVAITVRNRQLEHAESSDEVALGIRVLIGKQQACISGSDTRPEALDDMAERVVAMARLAPEDPCLGLAEPDRLATKRNTDILDTYAEDPALEPTELESIAREIESAALAVNGVESVEAASASTGQVAIMMRQSNGFVATSRKKSQAVGCAVIAGKDLAMETDYYGESRVFPEDMSSWHDIGRIAGERAVARLNPTRPATGHAPVLFDQRVSASLVGHFLSAINGEAITRGSSWLRDGLGTDVFPGTLSLTEDPWRKRSLASRLFDAEGLPTVQRDIVSNGVLETWILDLATARKLGLESTANASRSVASPPSPATSNITMTPGTISREELEREMGTGLVVTSLIGSTINPTTGDYSRGASGYWVTNGQPSGPVSEFTIAGNLREMLRTIVPANDADPFRRIQVPSLLVEGLTIAGN